MKPDYRKAGKNLRESVLDNSHLSAAELTQRLSEEGVDVNKFLTKVDEAFRKGLQQQVKAQATQARGPGSGP